MIFATKVIPVDRLGGDAARRQLTIESELDFLMRERGHIDRRRLEGHPGRVLPPAGQKLAGDVVLVMVDPGAGPDTAREIARALEN